MQNKVSDSLEKHPEIIEDFLDKARDDNFISKLTSVAKINQELFESIFPSFKILLNTKPELLKELWDEASPNHLNLVCNLIVEFNKAPENLDIFLANWALPLSREKKDYILDSMELKSYI